MYYTRGIGVLGAKEGFRVRGLKISADLSTNCGLNRKPGPNNLAKGFGKFVSISAGNVALREGV